MPAFLYEFEWDTLKAQSNLAKHGVDFERAATVFLDPLALTIPDDEHGEIEVRWITMGKDAADRYVHTFEALPDGCGRVRLISARRPTKTEVRDYEEHR